MNITLDNFRTLANGTANLGFVQLTHEDDGGLGIDKANNFKHRVWKNNTSEAASADNLVVRQKLVEAFTNAGAGTGFLRDLRTRLGLDNPQQQTAEVLTRNELRDIFNSYDRSVDRAESAGHGFDGLAEAHIPDAEQREMLGEQLRMLKTAFVDARMAAQSIDEESQVLLRFSRTLQDLRAAFPNNPQPVQAQPQPVQVQPDPVDPLKVQNEAIQRLQQEMAELQQQTVRLEQYQQASHEADKAVDADIEKIRDYIKTLPGFSDNQRLTVLDVVMTRVNQLRRNVSANVRTQMVERNEIDANEALYRLKKGWLDIDQAARTVVYDLGLNGVDPAHSEGMLFKELVRSKLENALVDQSF